MFHLIIALQNVLKRIGGKSSAPSQEPRRSAEGSTPKPHSINVRNGTAHADRPYRNGTSGTQKRTHLRLPENAAVVLINRSNEFIVAEGETELRIGDVLVVVADTAALDVVRNHIMPTVASR